jgi:hypothetical protein
VLLLMTRAFTQGALIQHQAVPAMRTLVSSIVPFLRWKGLLINLKKSRISAINYASGQAFPTDSITL